MRRLLALAIAGSMVAAAAVAEARPPAGHHSWGVQFGVGEGRLGAQVQSLTEELRDYFGAPRDAGVLVSRVEPGSPAAQAGLQPGDVIIEADGERVADPFDVITALSDRGNGEPVDLQIIRAGQPTRVTATMASDPIAVPGPRGLRMQTPGAGAAMGALGNQWIPHVWSLFSGPDVQALQQELRDTRKRLEELERRLEQLEKRRR